MNTAWAGKGGVQYHGQKFGGQAANQWRDQAKQVHDFYNPEAPFGPWLCLVAEEAQRHSGLAKAHKESARSYLWKCFQSSETKSTGLLVKKGWNTFCVFLLEEVKSLLNLVC